jgi:hypothetical protein
MTTQGVVPTVSGEGSIPEATARMRVALTPQQRRLRDTLARRAPELADMYLGALHVLEDRANPDRIAQAALSLRELMFHAPSYFDVIAQRTERMGDKANVLEQAWAKFARHMCLDAVDWEDCTARGRIVRLMRKVRDFCDWVALNRSVRRAVPGLFPAMDPLGRPLPEELARQAEERWFATYDYWNGVLHHGSSSADEPTVRSNIGELENFLAAHMSLTPFEDQAELDAVIREVEGNGEV